MEDLLHEQIPTFDHIKCLMQMVKATQDTIFTMESCCDAPEVNPPAGGVVMVDGELHGQVPADLPPLIEDVVSVGGPTDPVVEVGKAAPSKTRHGGLS